MVSIVHSLPISQQTKNLATSYGQVRFSVLNANMSEREFSTFVGFRKGGKEEGREGEEGESGGPERKRDLLVTRWVEIEKRMRQVWNTGLR